MFATVLLKFLFEKKKGYHGKKFYESRAYESVDHRNQKFDGGKVSGSNGELQHDMLA